MSGAGYAKPTRLPQRLLGFYGTQKGIAPVSLVGVIIADEAKVSIHATSELTRQVSEIIVVDTDPDPLTQTIADGILVPQVARRHPDSLRPRYHTGLSGEAARGTRCRNSVTSGRSAPIAVGEANRSKRNVHKEGMKWRVGLKSQRSESYPTES